MFKSKNAYVRELIARTANSRLSDEKANSAVYHMVSAMVTQPRAFDRFNEVQEPLNITDAFSWSETAPFNMDFWSEVNQAMVDLYTEAEHDQWIDEECDYPECEEETGCAGFCCGCEECETLEEVIRDARRDELENPDYESGVFVETATGDTSNPSDLFFPPFLQAIFGSHPVNPNETLPESFKESDVTFVDIAGEPTFGWGLVNKDTNEILPYFCESRSLARMLKDTDEKVVKTLLVEVATK